MYQNETFYFTSFHVPKRTSAQQRRDAQNRYDIVFQHPLRGLFKFHAPKSLHGRNRLAVRVLGNRPSAERRDVGKFRDFLAGRIVYRRRNAFRRASDYAQTEVRGAFGHIERERSRRREHVQRRPRRNQKGRVVFRAQFDRARAISFPDGDVTSDFTSAGV